MKDQERIPVELRWRLASRLVTYLPLAFGRACGEAGTADCDAIMQQVIREAAREARPVAAAFRLPVADAADIAETMGEVSEVFFGPGFRQRMIEGSKDQAIVRLTGCPIRENARMMGMDAGEASRLCRSFTASAIDQLNPAFSCRISRAMCAGHQYCEMIIERKS